MKKKEGVIVENPWLKWATELQFISQVGIAYSRDPFDINRFERVREISAEMMSLKSGWSIERVKDVFCNEIGYQTPKLDTRAAIFKDNKILLVQERNGKWSLPGGWVDVNQSIRTNLIKEVKEESGYDAIPIKLIAALDRKMHNLPVYPYGVCKIFVLCDIKEGDFVENIETVDRGFFKINELPLLSTEKNNTEQIEMCFNAYQSNDWEVVFD